MIYGYIRVSSDKQTTENQRFEISRFARSQGVKINMLKVVKPSGFKPEIPENLSKDRVDFHKGEI